MSMQSLELPLFQIENSASNSSLIPASENQAKHVPQIPKKGAVEPLVEVLESNPSIQNMPSRSPALSNSVTKTLNELFPEQEYQEKTIQKTKEVLGALAIDLTEENLRDIASEIQFLADSWLDDFEMEIFNGLTLNELLHEKGNL
jgi:uncharacterized protein YpuA (DUF1002 family)